jgi:hypothetical protein
MNGAINKKKKQVGVKKRKEMNQGGIFESKNRHILKIPLM